MATVRGDSDLEKDGSIRQWLPMVMVKGDGDEAALAMTSRTGEEDDAWWWR